MASPPDAGARLVVSRSEPRNNAFGGRCLKRGSWLDRWAFIEHVRALGLESNQFEAHPFE